MSVYTAFANFVIFCKGDLQSIYRGSPLKILAFQFIQRDNSKYNLRRLEYIPYDHIYCKTPQCKYF